MAFAPDGRLLHANENALHVLDQATGHASVLVRLIYPTGLTRPRVSSMKFQPDTGELFGIMKTNDFGKRINTGTYLVKIDVASGVVTIVGARTLDGLDGLVWGPSR